MDAVTNHGAFRHDIQGLRAIAVFLVVAYHAGFGFSGGFVGVDVFFVVSGFVITRMLSTELNDHGRVNFRRFYLRRIRRLLPALCAMLTGVLVLSMVFTPLASQGVTARTGIAAALINANTYLAHFAGSGGYFGLGSEANALLHTWSLSVEEQFYVVFPFLFAAAWAVSRRKKTSRRTTANHPINMAILIAVAIVSFVASWLLTSGRVNPSGRGIDIAFYYAPFRAWEFAIGAIIALFSTRMATISRTAATSLSLVGIGLLTISAFIYDDNTLFPGVTAVVPVIATALLITGGGSTVTNIITRILGVKPLRFIGDISYSWYLWHWPFIVFAAGLWSNSSLAKVVAAGLSLIPAWASYRFIESPIRARKDAPPRRTLALGAICVALPVLASFALIGTHRLLNNLSLFAPFALHSDVQRGCSTPTPMGMRTGLDCRWETPNPRGVAVLVGDSNAGQFTEGFVLAANSIELDADIATQSSCPFVDLRLQTWSKENTTCAYFVAKTMAHLISIKPEVVVIASANDGYIKQPYFSFRSPDGKISYVTSEEKAQAIEDGLAHVIRILRGAKIRVVIVHTIPKFEKWEPIAMAPIRIIGPSHWMTATIAKSTALGARQTAFGAEKRAADESGAATLDFFNELCPTDHCSTRANGIWIYRDYGHISVEKSRQLSATFAQALSGK